MDARPPETPLTRALSQRFLGWEIHAETDCFDTDVVELMDFRGSSDQLHFFYVLPYGPRHALVESTLLSPCSQQHDYEAELCDYLQQRYGVTQHYQVYQQHSCLNLRLPLPSVFGAGIAPPGRTAGTLRPSAGFALLETISDAKRIAQCFVSVATGVASISAFCRDVVDLQRDKIFFDGLSADWKRGPEHFMALFEGLGAETLVAFLAGRPEFSQRLRVAMQLPKLDFLRAAGRHALKEVS